MASATPSRRNPDPLQRLRERLPRRVALDVLTVDHAPVTIDHDAIDRQPVARKYEGIEQRVIAVADQHRVVVIQRDQVGWRADVDASRRRSAGLGATPLRPDKQLAPDMRLLERRDVA
ncbi:MAG: hypothetical protein GWO21_04160 [Gammaproteobacteria bacterium]|nr:hypothetical protein [Gammaproteobacteria bacterium]